MRKYCCVCALALSLVLAAVANGEQEVGDVLQVPASTAYCEPDSEALPIAENGITGWSDPKDKIVWYGYLHATGKLNLALLLRFSPGTHSRFKLSVEKQAHIAEVSGSSQAMPTTIGFGSFKINSPGPYRFVLEGLSKRGASFGEPEALLLSGPAAKEAHFSKAHTRGAPSVHLFYSTSRDAPIVCFYNEVTVKTDPLWSYYMACGFHRGYFGIQVNSPTERRIIFSVWDSGTEAVDRGKVVNENRVQLIAKGDNVFAGGFGNEGTGGHSHLVYNWKTGDTYRFLVTAQPEGSTTVYSGYFYFPEKKQWGLIASFRAPKDGGYLHGLYSFNEDFNGANGQQKRWAEFGPQWIKLADGKWEELLSARFSHTSDGAKERMDRDGGTVSNRFYLTNGGFTAGRARYGDPFTRSASGNPPGDRDLPPLPQ